LQISRVEFCQVAVDAGLDLFHAPLQLGTGEVPVTVVDRLYPLGHKELAAINGSQGFCKQHQLSAQHDKLPTHTADRFAIVLTEVGDGLEFRHQATRQSHQFNIALRLFLQAAA